MVIIITFFTRSDCQVKCWTFTKNLFTTHPRLSSSFQCTLWQGAINVVNMRTAPETLRVCDAHWFLFLDFRIWLGDILWRCQCCVYYVAYLNIAFNVCELYETSLKIDNFSPHKQEKRVIKSPKFKCFVIDKKKWINKDGDNSEYLIIILNCVQHSIKVKYNLYGSQFYKNFACCELQPHCF